MKKAQRQTEEEIGLDSRETLLLLLLIIAQGQEHDGQQGQGQEVVGDATGTLQEGQEHDGQQGQGQEVVGDASGTLQESQEHDTGERKTRDLSMVTVKNILKSPDTILHESTVAQSDDQIPSISESHNENFRQGISWQLHTSNQHNANDVVQNTPASSNKVTNVSFNRSSYRKGERSTQPFFETSYEDKEDSFSDLTDSLSFASGGYSGDNKQSEKQEAKGQGNSREEQRIAVEEQLDFPDPHHDLPSVDIGSSDSLSDHTDSLSSSPGGYSGDNEQSEEEEEHRGAIGGQSNSREERRISWENQKERDFQVREEEEEKDKKMKQVESRKREREVLKTRRERAQLAKASPSDSAFEIELSDHGDLSTTFHSADDERHSGE